MTKNPPQFSLDEDVLYYPKFPPSFQYRLPDGKLEFDIDLMVLKRFFNHHCCAKWINKLEVVDYFKRSSSFQEAMQEASLKCQEKYFSVYFGTFELGHEHSSCRSILFSANLVDNQLRCILLGFKKDIIASKSYKSAFRPVSKSAHYLSLTGREKEVLARIADGFTTKEIASELFLSVHTVDSHKQKLYKKLKVRNTAELGKLAERYGLTRDASFQI